MNAYEQMFFNQSSTSDFRKEKPQSRSIGPAQQVVYNDKSKGVVDFGGLAGIQGYQETPSKEFTHTTAQKSMIGHSDFVPVGTEGVRENHQLLVGQNPYADFNQQTGKKS